ncbi:hypothetical protein V5799_017175, partial [Amblyomma americanum]
MHCKLYRSQLSFNLNGYFFVTLLQWFKSPTVPCDLKLNTRPGERLQPLENRVIVHRSSTPIAMCFATAPPFPPKKVIQASSHHAITIRAQDRQGKSSHV